MARPGCRGRFTPATKPFTPGTGDCPKHFEYKLKKVYKKRYKPAGFEARYITWGPF